MMCRAGRSAGNQDVIRRSIADAWGSVNVPSTPKPVDSWAGGRRRPSAPSQEGHLPLCFAVGVGHADHLKVVGLGYDTTLARRASTGGGYTQTRMGHVATR